MGVNFFRKTFMRFLCYKMVLYKKFDQTEQNYSVL